MLCISLLRFLSKSLFAWFKTIALTDALGFVVGCRIRDIRALSEQEILCASILRKNGKRFSVLFKANIKTGDVKFSTLPLKHVEDYWLLPAPFPWFSLFFITRVCEGYCGPIYEHHVLDARTMRLERLFLGESATLQAILPNGSLLLADNNSFQVLDIEGVQSLCGVLKKEINQGLKNLPTVLVEVVRDYLNQDVNVSAHFASFYNKKRAEENQRAFLRQKAPSDELTSLCCRMM